MTIAEDLRRAPYMPPGSPTFRIVREDVLWEAADRIEELEATITKLHETIDTPISENERLRRALKEIAHYTTPVPAAVTREALGGTDPHKQS